MRKIHVVCLVLMLVSCPVLAGNDDQWWHGTWWTDAEVFLGVEQTLFTSPQCYSGTESDKLTSNLGLRGNIFESRYRKFRFNWKYQHHSCVFNDDHLIYDALGFEFTWKLWSKH